MTPETAPTDPIRLILHIGMGKTGTSAIQKALRESAEVLAAQGAHFLGMDIDPTGLPQGQHILTFLRKATPDDAARLGEAYAADLLATARRTGAQTLILSNEAFLGAVDLMMPFLAPVLRQMEVTALIWARDPQGWLPSAHAQWAVRHKIMPGMVEPMAIAGRRLVTYYKGILEWRAALPGRVVLRPYHRDLDIVADFAAAAGITLPPHPQRVYERPSEVELVLRALYNGGLPGEVLPAAFEAAVQPHHVASLFQRLPHMARQVLDYSDAQSIIDDHAPLFDQIAAETGIELRDLGGEALPEPVAGSVLRNRMVDYLAALTLAQADRILSLEQRLARLEKRLAEPSCDPKAKA